MARKIGGDRLSCWGWLALGCGLSAFLLIIFGTIAVSEIRHAIAGLSAADGVQTPGVISLAGTGVPGGKESQYRLLLALCLGIGLSAASGFRVFLPPLLLSIAVRTGDVAMAPDWEAAFGSDLAVAVLSAATVVEVIAYYVPWLDNALDTIALPAAITAGIILSAACTTQMDPHVRWAFVVIAGGVQAGLVQSITTAARLGSSTMTGGLGNPIVSTVEAGSSGALSILSLSLPLVAAPLVVCATIVGVVRYRRRLLGMARRQRVRQQMLVAQGRGHGTND